LKKYKWYMIGGLVVWLCFVWLGIVRLDPDYGWHVRMGEYIVKNGIPATDPFSYTMANFPFIDHEWLTNIGMYWGDKVIGKNGMAILAATMVFIAIFAAVPRKHYRWVGVPALLVFSVWWPRAGVRPQIEDWILLPIVIRLVGDRELWKKWKWILPIIMLIWANIHGGFAVGLAVSGTILFVRMIEDRRLKLEDFLVLGVSGLVTLINPYGIRLWAEVWQQISDRKVGRVIAEWQPFYTQIELGWIFLAVWIGTMCSRYWKKVEKWNLVVVFVFFVASISTLRHAALFAVTGLMLACELMEKMFDEFKKNKLAVARLLMFYRWMVILCGVIFALAVIQTIFNPMIKLTEKFYYPVGAIGYVKEHGVKGKMYSEYGWGGYLEWKLPEVKTFIDGRMATWKWKSPDSSYSDYVFGEYMDMITEGLWQKWVDKYGIETVMLPKKRGNSLSEWIIGKISKLGVRIPKNKTTLSLEGQLINAGWKVVYEDEVAVILEKP
jgi:hypothetical protein